MVISNEYPWPPKELSPNRRIFWRKKNPIKRQYRDMATLTTKPMRLTDAQKNSRMSAKVTFCPPDNRNRDWDNLVASCKTLFDGMCIRLGIDDKQIKQISINFGEKVKDGCVRVDLTLP